MEGESGSIEEAVGATVGEAKWQAMRALRMRFSGLQAEDVTFEELEAGEGSGGETRVRATVDVGTWQARSSRFGLSDDPVERVREVVVRIVDALGLMASVSVEERSDELVVSVDGEDLGLLIGVHGRTIDAVQHVAGLIAFHGAAQRNRVVVDAGGYRERRAMALRRKADRVAADVLRMRESVELVPMNAAERRIVHLHLADRVDVETHSEGDEPDRFVVVSPSRR